MSLIRYNLEADFGVPYMDEDTTGDWVRLDDVVKLLETWCCRTDDCSFDKVLRNYTECEISQEVIALIKGEK